MRTPGKWHIGVRVTAFPGKRKKNGIKFWSVKPGDRGGDRAKHCEEESTLDEGVGWEKCCCLFKRE